MKTKELDNYLNEPMLLLTTNTPISPYTNVTILLWALILRGAKLGVRGGGGGGGLPYRKELSLKTFS